MKPVSTDFMSELFQAINEITSEIAAEAKSAKEAHEAIEPDPAVKDLRSSDPGGFYIENGAVLLKLIDPKRLAAAIEHNRRRLNGKLNQLQLGANNFDHDEAEKYLRELNELLRLTQYIKPDFK